MFVEGEEMQQGAEAFSDLDQDGDQDLIIPSKVNVSGSFKGLRVPSKAIPGCIAAFKTIPAVIFPNYLPRRSIRGRCRVLS